VRTAHDANPRPREDHSPPPSPLITPSDDPDAERGLRRRVVRGGTLAALGFVVSQAVSLASFIVLVRLAPPATFGAYAGASLLVGASLLFTEAGMQAAVIQRSDGVREAASTAFVANVVGGFILAAVAAAFAPVIGLFFHSSEIARAAAVMAGTIPINAAAIVPGALLQRRVSFRFVFVQPLAALRYGAAAIAALAGGLGLWGLVLATYASACTQTLVVWLLARWRPSFSLVSWQMWRSLSSYGRPVLLSSLLREVGFSGSIAVVGRAFGTSDLGRFRSAQRFVLQANSAIVFGSAYVLLPAFARIWQDEPRFQNSILRALRILTLIVFPVSLLFIPLGRPFATILLGPQWRGAGPIMMAMAGVGIALALDSISSEAFKATGRTDLLPRMHGLTAVVPVALMLALLPLGAPGMGLAMSLGMGTVAAFAIRALARIARLPFPTILLQMRPAAAAGASMVVGVYLLDRFLVHAEQSRGLLGVGLLCVDVVAAAAIYLGSLLLVSRRSAVELKELGELLLRRIDPVTLRSSN
jgi:O-antigen/teichoic acid export membrane protein